MIYSPIDASVNEDIAVPNSEPEQVVNGILCTTCTMPGVEDYADAAILEMEPWCPTPIQMVGENQKSNEVLFQGAFILVHLRAGCNEVETTYCNQSMRISSPIPDLSTGDLICLIATGKTTAKVLEICRPPFNPETTYLEGEAIPKERYQLMKAKIDEICLRNIEV
ncbi:hypothetical protein KC678_00680 [Candidatus Dojkabacteria bacterium]|uniref:Uncharacterized protein n=1 Tax=Candidatus Dojkabacteria bacterium TaxID=2099670 RepID=A0A955L1J5_9BACT|nr:hypothetical protein [Candidatus Dojkabacteria bacterium]